MAVRGEGQTGERDGCLVSSLSRKRNSSCPQPCKERRGGLSDLGEPYLYVGKGGGLSDLGGEPFQPAGKGGRAAFIWEGNLSYL